jgi:hypothetical protein
MNFTGKDGNIYKTFNSAFPNQHSKKNMLGRQTSTEDVRGERSASPGVNRKLLNNVRVSLGGNMSSESKLERRARARVQSANTFKRGHA